MTVVKSRRRKRIKFGIRKKVNGTQSLPRLSVFRSNKAIYAQLIDDDSGATLAAASSSELGDTVKLNIETSRKVGEKIAEKALAAGIKKIVFDRNGYLFHGNVKALAESARGKGLEF
jgi:large subunit ribosomal protein L18